MVSLHTFLDNTGEYVPFKKAILHKMISKIQLIGNKQVTLFVKLNR